MKYYIVDDEIGTVKTLENIVESRDLGEVIGYATDPEKAIGEILALQPDIILVDLLMSKMDGIALVGQIKKVRPKASFVMISQVADKDMIEQAYNAGVEFFINKPVNIIEVEKVLGNVSEKIKMNSLVAGIRGMFAETEELSRQPARREDVLREINVFLGLLGMLGEKGTSDILSVCQYLIEHDEEYSKEVLTRVAAEKLRRPKTWNSGCAVPSKKG